MRRPLDPSINGQVINSILMKFYLFVTKKILFKRVSEPIAKFDKKYVDGTVVGIGNKTVLTSEKIKGIQSGRIQDYAFAFIAGVVILVLVFIYL